GAMLRRFAAVDEPRAGLMSWALALLWALHPTLTGAFAADMGRTHLMSALFLLLSLDAHLRGLATGRGGHFVWSIVLFVLAMMCKPVAGWVVIVFAIETAAIGFSATIRSQRVYIYGLLCVFFASLTLWATQAENMLEDSEPALFGNPLTRSAVA